MLSAPPSADWAAIQIIPYFQHLSHSFARPLEFSAALAMPLAVTVLLAWFLRRNEVAKLAREVSQTQARARQLQRERDLAQEELFRRLYEERELNKQKSQFQAQLADYEKYAALARLALGAAHEINNPLLGILSHLELELKEASDPERAVEWDPLESTCRHASLSIL